MGRVAASPGIKKRIWFPRELKKIIKKIINKIKEKRHHWKVNKEGYHSAYTSLLQPFKTLLMPTSLHYTYIPKMQ